MNEPWPAATKIPPGQFHGLFSWLFGRGGASESSPVHSAPAGTSAPSRHIAQFLSDAPLASYAGVIDGQETWFEHVTDPVTGVGVVLAYTTSNNGATAEAYCVDPDMRNHTLGIHTIHCFEDGRLCTDDHSVIRNLPEKRARAVLWVSGFANYLKEGRFAVDSI